MPKVLTIDPGDLTRPNFPKIVEQMLKKGIDVEVTSKTHVISLWRAIQRAGYWSWSYRVGERAWRVRLSKKPTTGKVNPLIEECQQKFKTPYGQWRQHVPALLEGKAIPLPTKEEANQFSRSARYHLRKEEAPPFKIVITPEKRKFVVQLVWKESE